MVPVGGQRQQRWRLVPPVVPPALVPPAEAARGMSWRCWRSPSRQGQSPPHPLLPKRDR